uniref:Peptidase S9 prolyl oligopeptidase catalytic domain-containing protein n=1 Tax=Strongyloides stercoralis TaxID=6248 RepID=A0A0K0ERT2_STRER
MIIQNDCNKKVNICKRMNNSLMLEGDDFTEFTESLLHKCSCSFSQNTSTSTGGTFIHEEDKKINDIINIVTSNTDYHKLSMLSDKFNTFNYNVPKKSIILTKENKKFLKQLNNNKYNKKCPCIGSENNSTINNAITFNCGSGRIIFKSIKKSIQLRFKKYFDNDILCQQVWKPPTNKYYMVKNINYHSKDVSYKMLPEHSSECSSSLIKHFLIPTSSNNVIAGSYILINSNPKYTIIYSHTEDTNLYHYTQTSPNIQSIANFLNVNFVTYDYTSYGMSTGTLSIENLQKNLKTIIEYVNTKLGIEKDKIILWGSSLGGTLSANITVNQTDISGLILFEAPNTMLEYFCYKDNLINYHKYKKDPKYRRDFNTSDAVSKINIPILIVRNQYTTNVSHSSCFQIFKSTTNTAFCYTVTGCKKNDLFYNSEALLRVKEFLEYDIN